MYVLLVAVGLGECRRSKAVQATPTLIAEIRELLGCDAYGFGVPGSAYPLLERLQEGECG